MHSLGRADRIAAERQILPVCDEEDDDGCERKCDVTKFKACSKRFKKVLVALKYQKIMSLFALLQISFASAHYENVIPIFMLACIIDVNPSACPVISTKRSP